MSEGKDIDKSARITHDTVDPAMNVGNNCDTYENILMRDFFFFLIGTCLGMLKLYGTPS